MSLGSMATGTPQGHAPIARPVCSLHKTPKRAHYYCLQCVKAGEYEVNINSANVAGPADAGSHETLSVELIEKFKRRAHHDAMVASNQCNLGGDGMLAVKSLILHAMIGAAVSTLAASASAPAAPRETK
jgi:hypothetical protein